MWTPPGRRLRDGCYHHAKAVIVEVGQPKAQALITNANFSDTAQRHNDEAGCLMTSPWQVNRLAEHVLSLVQQGCFSKLADE